MFTYIYVQVYDFFRGPFVLVIHIVFDIYIYVIQ